jgi:pimeloyl-ACP methyl ester carboxylesterase
MAHVTFIHGIANKPPRDVLLRSWITALGDGDGPELDALGVSSSMVYWANFLYSEPAAVETAYETAEAMERAGVDKVDMGWVQDAGGMEAAMIAGLSAKIGLRELATGGSLPAGEELVPGAADEVASAVGPEGEFERVPLPGPLKGRLMEVLLRDVHHYLFNATFSPRPGEQYAIQDVIRAEVVSALAEGAARPGPHVLVTHSMGTVIAYDCLKRVPGCPSVDALVTIGSPLGLDEIQNRLKPEWSHRDGFPTERLLGQWVNVFDRLDPVAGFAPSLARDYQHRGDRLIRDVEEPNYGRWRHSISKYLAGVKLRAALEELLGL